MRHVTVMFCDLRSYTTIAEVLPIERLLQFLERYLTVMARIVHLFKGTVAEIQGDGLLCFWNAECDIENHAGRACAAACAMTQAVTMLSEEFAQQGLPCIKIGIGIHAGYGLSGIIGSREKLKWGVLGDTVNLTSRLESLCKFYQVNIVCSQAVHELLPVGFNSRRLDRVKVRGRQEPVNIFQIFGFSEQEMLEDSAGSADSVHVLHQRAYDSGLILTMDSETAWPFSWEASEADIAYNRLYEVGLEAYQNADFKTALAITQALLTLDPRENQVTELLSQEVRAMSRQQGGLSPAEHASWRGIRIFD
eukprot:TRINITY_DN73162_c0_g1_i1.p1 TRINITY_DN73162_c0_g1~~TRINITY_DN73162_c0_g1_i1.p1  ORF type:complete len:326 (+),score=50.82 TRINITY_DN73162_c0_g1_i1:59-979(+)